MAAVCDLSRSQSGIEVSHSAARRARHRAAREAVGRKLKAAYKRIRDLELQLAVVQTSAAGSYTSWLLEVVDRLTALAPGLAVQLEAKSAGMAYHSSSGLLLANQHVLAGSAQHAFSLLISEISPAMARKAQGARAGQKNPFSSRILQNIVFPKRR